MDKRRLMCRSRAITIPARGAAEIVTAAVPCYFLALRFAFFAVFFLAAFFLAAMCFPLRRADSFRSAQ